MVVDVVWFAAMIGLVGVFCVHVVAAVRARDMLARVLRMDAASTTVVAMLLVLTLLTGTSYYLDAALVLALLAFLGTLVSVRALAGRGLFS